MENFFQCSQQKAVWNEIMPRLEKVTAQNVSKEDQDDRVDIGVNARGGLYVKSTAQLLRTRKARALMKQLRAIRTNSPRDEAGES